MASTPPPDRKFSKSKASGLLLILFIVGLYLLQNKAIVPFVEKVARSDAFDTDSSELTGKDRQQAALNQCIELVRAELSSDRPLQFAANDYKAWEVANGRYLISSYVLEQDPSGKELRRNYACNIQYTGGDDTNANSWSLQGLELRDM